MKFTAAEKKKEEDGKKEKGKRIIRSAMTNKRRNFYDTLLSMSANTSLAVSQPTPNTSLDRPSSNTDAYHSF